MRFAMLFPGQGSQSVGMLGELAGTFDCVRKTFVEASEALSFDLEKLVYEGPQEELDSTVRTQPAMLAGGVAVWRAWKEQGGPDPAFMAGHSLGEYTALVCSGALGFADALRLVVRRAQLMQAAVPAGVGAMAAVLGLDDDVVREVCAESAGKEVVEAVNFNAPGQVVIAGHAAAVERAVEAAKSRGSKLTKMLPVSVPSHCRLMLPAAEKLAEFLKGISIAAPGVPVLQNIDAKTRSNADEIRRALVDQLYSPVQWVRTVQEISAQNANTLLECGPGNVLTGLNRRINRALQGQSLQDNQGFAKGLEIVRGS